MERYTRMLLFSGLVLLISSCATIVPMINFGTANVQPPELRILNSDSYETTGNYQSLPSKITVDGTGETTIKTTTTTDGKLKDGRPANAKLYRNPTVAELLSGKR